MELSERIPHSAYLTSIVETNPGYLTYLQDSQPSLRQSLEQLIQQVSDVDAAVLTDTEQFKKNIRQIKSGVTQVADQAHSFRNEYCSSVLNFGIE